MNELSRGGFGRRLAWATCGAVSGALIAAFLIALAQSALWGLPAIPSAGLLMVFALVLALALGTWVPLVHRSGTLPRLSKVLARPEPRLRLLLGGPFAVIAWWGAGYLALRLMAAFEERSERGGLLLAVTALGCLVMGGQVVYRGAHFLASRVTPPSATRTLVIAGVLTTSLVVLSILIGNPGGSGAPFALFGVFLRNELNLTPIFVLVALAAIAYAGAYLVLWRSLIRTSLSIAVVLFSLGVVALVQASKIDYSQALAFERAPGLTRYSLSLLQSLSDADRDGVGAAFGGGDCNDRDPSIAPGKIDIAGNGVDEDCSGSDRVVVAPRAAQEPETEPEKDAALPKSPNFLLLTIDTARWDVGYSGAASRPDLTPHLDALAERSTVFERAYSLASYTSKSLGPMMIGRYPSETDRTFEHFDRFSKEVPFIQERLQAEGIRTVAVHGYWYFFFKTYGFERGWDTLDSSAAPRVVAIEGDRTKNGDKVATAAIEQLGELARADTQFFAWVHWVDPHAEYVRHEEFDYGNDDRARYDGEVSFVDAQVGRILDALAELELQDETVVLVTSDHGEAFGEHGMIRHGFEVWEELVRVPLLLFVPGAPAKRVAVRRSLIDVAPTILDTFDIEKPTGDDFVRGTSLLEEALAPADAEFEERPVLVDMPEGPHNKQRRAFYQGDLKLITSGGRVIGLFDLKNDPAEKHDLSEDEAELDAMRQAQDAFLGRLAEIPARR